MRDMMRADDVRTAEQEEQEWEARDAAQLEREYIEHCATYRSRDDGLHWSEHYQCFLECDPVFQSLAQEFEGVPPMLLEDVDPTGGGSCWVENEE